MDVDWREVACKEIAWKERKAESGLSQQIGEEREPITPPRGRLNFGVDSSKFGKRKRKG